MNQCLKELQERLSVQQLQSAWCWTASVQSAWQ